MGTVQPAILAMALDTQARVFVWHHKKLAEIVIMRIMATRALHLAGVVNIDFLGQIRRQPQLSALIGKLGVIQKGHRMVMPQVRTGSGSTRWNPP
jgi:hypothetical protein